MKIDCEPISDYEIRKIREIDVFDISKAAISEKIHTSPPQIDKILLGKIRKGAGGKIYTLDEVRRIPKIDGRPKRSNEANLETTTYRMIKFLGTRTHTELIKKFNVKARRMREIR